MVWGVRPCFRGGRLLGAGGKYTGQGLGEHTSNEVDKGAHSHDTRRGSGGVSGTSGYHEGEAGHHSGVTGMYIYINLTSIAQQKENPILIHLLLTRSTSPSLWLFPSDLWQGRYECVTRDRSGKETFCFDRIETTHFFPEETYFRKCTEAVAVHQFQEKSRHRKPVYVITGVKAVKGARAASLKDSSFGGGLQRGCI